MRTPEPKKRNVPFHLQALGYRVVKEDATTITLAHPEQARFHYYPLTLTPGPDLTLGDCTELIARRAYEEGAYLERPSGAPTRNEDA